MALFVSAFLTGTGFSILIGTLPINPLIGLVLSAFGLVCVVGSIVERLENLDNRIITKEQ